MMMKAISGAFVMKYKACSIYRRDHKSSQRIFIHIGSILDGIFLGLIFKESNSLFKLNTV